MFERLRKAVDAALSALEARSGLRPQEDLDRLLRKMREELIDARARLPKLQEAVRDGEREMEAELDEAEACARRARQAQEIGDEETVRVALRFEERHRQSALVLQRRLEASRAELVLHRRTVSEMTEQLKEATARRDALAARARRAGATERVRGGRPEAFDAFERVADAVEREEAAAAGEAEVDELLGGGGDPEPLDPELDPETLAELQLRELKRRMMREGRGGEGKE